MLKIVKHKLGVRLRNDNGTWTTIYPDEDELDEEMQIVENEGVPLPSQMDSDMPSMDSLLPHKDRIVEMKDKKLSGEFEKLLREWFLVKNNEPIKDYVFKIDLKPNVTPFRTRPRRYSEIDRAFTKAWTDELLERGWIKHNPAAKWVSPVIVVNGKRGVVDLRRLNQATEQTAYPLPHIDVVLSKVRKAKYFARLDLKSGYWQVKCDDATGEYMSFMTDEGVFTPTRLIMGCTNGVFAFQALMTEILHGIEFKIIWIDDILLYADSLEELLKILQEVKKRFTKRNVKINWEKSEFLLTSVKFLGRIVDGDGVRFDDEFVNSIIGIPRPVTGGQLGQFLNMANYMRPSLIDFARRSKALYELMEQVYTKGGGRTKRKTEKFSIEALWNENHEKAFEEVKNTVATQMKCSFVDSENDLYLVGDASENGWCLLVCQGAQEERKKPFIERKLSPVLSLSGLFKGASSRWHIMQKELFPFVKALDRISYLLHRRNGFVILCDNKTLTHVLNPTGYLVDNGKQMVNRVSRWLLKFCGYYYHVEAISGAENYFCDLVSRWGNKDNHRPIQVQETVNAIHVFQDGKDIGISKEQEPLAQNIEEIIFPSLNEFKITQDDLEEDNSMAIKDGMAYFKEKLLFVPNRENLRERIFVAAHMGQGGHRGIDVTVKAIKDRFYWDTLEDDVKLFTEKCLTCQLVKGTARMHRPWGTGLRGEKPMELIHLDFLYAFQGTLLVIKDDVSMMVELVPIPGAMDAETTALALVHWFMRYGIPKYITTDRGGQFISKLVEELANHYMIVHHLTMIDIHYNNGVIERVNREVNQLLKLFLIEFKLEISKWREVLPAVQASLNNTPSRRLGGNAPITVFCGRQPSNALDAIVVDSSIRRMSKKSYEELSKRQISDLQEELAKIHEEARDSREKITQQNKKARDKSKAVKFFEAGVGDYVLISKLDRKINSKLVNRWMGPYVITDVGTTGKCYTVTDLVGKNQEVVHWSRIKPFAEKGRLAVDLDRVKIAAMGFDVEVLKKIRRIKRDFEFLVGWEGFEEQEDTWEPARNIYEDIPQMVLEFIQKNAKDALIPQLKKYLGIN